MGIKLFDNLALGYVPQLKSTFVCTDCKVVVVVLPLHTGYVVIIAELVELCHTS